ncbi:serine protease, partial [Staphylococcus sp. SIMBA_130]
RNSGGALIYIYGQLIRINSMKINQAAVERISFVIPIDHALPIIEELETTGEVTRPYLGVEIYSLDEVPQTEWRDTLNLPSEVD